MLAARDLRQAFAGMVSPRQGRARDRLARAPAARRRSLGRLMQNGLYVAVSAQVALERRMETIADNIANMNTVGYRATGVSFAAEMAKAGETDLNYVSSGADFLSRRIGGLDQDRQSARFRGPGRRLVRHPDADGTRLHPRRARPHRRVRDAANAERRPDPRRGRRADPGRQRRRAADRLRRRHDQSERPPGRRDRALRHRRGRQPEAGARIPASFPTSPRGRSSISPGTAWSRGRSRVRTSIRCAR